MNQELFYAYKEIRLESGRQIKVLNILKNNKPLNISGYFLHKMLDKMEM